MLQQEQLDELIQKSQRGETTLEEETLLLEWIDTDPQNLALLARSKNLDVLIRECVAYAKMSTEEAKERVWARWQKEKDKKTPIHQLLRWIGYAAAAVVVLTVGVIIFKAMMRPPVQQNNVPAVARLDSANAPSPGSDRAILYLANGKQLIIGDTAKGYLARQDNLEFTKAGGVIYCKTLPATAAPKTIRYHTLVIPRGGRYQLVLPDGSKVWLNSASRIQFPTIDTGNIREVYLEGEAYFEVAYNKRKPFIVKVNDANVKVTGTHFNIVSYPTESLSKATLLEGHISVNSGGKDELVAPNYSAIFSKGSKPRIVKEANIDKIMAWKNRQFFWKQDSLTTALREIARWYNVTVKYEGAPPTTIIDYVVDSRSKPLNELMELITTSDRGDTTAYFELKDSTLIVSTNRLH